MGKMNDEYVKLRDLYTSGKRDPAAIGQQQQRIYDLRRQMVESSVEAQNRMEAVLTPEQKEQRARLRSGLDDVVAGGKRPASAGHFVFHCMVAIEVWHSRRQLVESTLSRLMSMRRNYLVRYLMHMRESDSCRATSAGR